MKYNIHLLRTAVIGLSLCASLWSASAQESKTTRPKQRGERDPFSLYRPPAPRKKVVRLVPVRVTPPSIQDRIDRYKAQKAQAMGLQKTAPKATTALLLGEMQVIGIFRTPRGFAAMVEATPIHLSYVVYPGEIFYDGQLVAIEENRLVFRQETRWSDGRRDKKVETKPLRKPNAVAESLAATRGANGTGAATASEPAREEKAATADKQ